MNQLTCTSFSFPLLSFDRALRLIALLEIPRFDVGAHEGGPHIQPSEVEANPQAVADRIRRAAEEAGLQASDFFPTFGHGFRDRALNTPDRETRARNLARFRALAGCASAVGAGGITLLPGVVWSELGPERSLDLSIEAFGELTPIAADVGLRLSFEPHLESVTESPQLAAQLADAVPGLRVTLDYSHFVAGGHSPDDVHPLASLAGHFHARQAAPGRLQASAKNGALDFPDIVARLRAAGYGGDLCIEYTWQDWRDCWHEDVVSESILLRDLLRPLLD